MAKSEQKYHKDKSLSDSVTKTKVSHGRIETAVRVRNAKSKGELDLELKRLNVLNEIDKSSVPIELKIPPELKKYQQLILIIGSLRLKSTTELYLAAKKLGYTGALNRKRIKTMLFEKQHKHFFKYDKGKGWHLTNEAQNEFSRLKQFL